MDWRKRKRVGDAPRGIARIGVVAALIACAWSPPRATADDAWRPGPSKLSTPFAEDVSSRTPRPEYPRPQLRRRMWLNLNGLWEFAEEQPGDEIKFGAPLNERILVPYPVESSLSGITRPAHRVVYRREFEIPASWRGRRVKLHFGAVDWEATVYLNGRQLGVHRGGYDGFSFDITDELRRSGPQELIVRVFDPTDRGEQPRGVQMRVPSGQQHTSATGIWRTVWLEPVPETYITDVRLTPDVDDSTLSLDVSSFGADELHSIQAEAEVDGVIIARVYGGADGRLRLCIPREHLRLWSPEDPFLYDLTLTLFRNGQLIERVESYFGMRKVEIVTDDGGTARIHLNGEPIFMLGVLDQGYWPEGVYTAPTEEAMVADIETARRLGFNMIRKHAKVEPDRWYYWCDRLGMLVWQDIPGGANTSLEAREQFRAEFEEIVGELHNHPSIVQWIVFHQGGGQHDAKKYVAWLQADDPTRLVTGASGWNDTQSGDVRDAHHFPEPIAPPLEPTRAVAVGGFGGLALAVPQHSWDGTVWGYRSMDSKEEFTATYGSLLETLRSQADKGLSAAVYTQLTDVETECTGLLTYDRRRLKIAFEDVVASNRELLDRNVRTTNNEPIELR